MGILLEHLENFVNPIRWGLFWGADLDGSHPVAYRLAMHGEILTEAVAIGLLFSLYASESLGYVAGGLVVPGYFAVISSSPGMLVATLLASLLSLGVLRLLSRVMLLYGRRRLMLAVLLGFLFAELSRRVVVWYPSPWLFHLQAFGFIIPGLLAYWMDRQGVGTTLGMLVVNVALIRLVLILLHGGKVVV